MAIKPLSEQTIMNNYVFYKIMREPRRIKPLLKYILHKKIHNIRVIESEKTLKEMFASKGVRLDLYVEDTDGVIYDVEVQTTDNGDIAFRMRYYQGMLDLTFFPAGADYNKMRKSFIIFICNYDPYHQDRYIYTFQNHCDQDQSLLFGDECVKVVVNVKGSKGRISKELKEAILYLGRQEVTGPYSKELDDAVNELKKNEEARQEYMTWSTYGAEERAAGKRIDKVEMIRGWYDDHSSLPMADAAKFAKVTIPQFESVLDLIKSNPKMADEEIANRVNWRMYQ